MDNSGKERRILTLLESGDRRVAEELYNAYAGYLAGVCARYVEDNDDLSDVLQESFIKIFSSLGSFRYRGEGSLKAWLTRIVVNQSLKFLKESCRFGFVGIPADAHEIPDEEEMADIRAADIVDILRDMPVGYRTVINLHVFEGKSHKEIAELLDIKENSSVSQFHRAKALLARKIKEYQLHKQSVGYGR